MTVGDDGRWDQAWLSRTKSDSWVDAALASLCATYSEEHAAWAAFPVFRCSMDERCEHQWCHGIVDMITRVSLKATLIDE